MCEFVGAELAKGFCDHRKIYPASLVLGFLSVQSIKYAGQTSSGKRRGAQDRLNTPRSPYLRHTRGLCNPDNFQLRILPCTGRPAFLGRKNNNQIGYRV